MNRCNLFHDQADREKFLELLAEISERYGLEVHVLCLMGSHYHLQVRSTEGRISEAMRDLGGRYARWFNRRHGRTGPLFGGRFRSVLITSDEQLVNTWTYIHRNPVDIGVSDIATYPWSSATAYLDPAARPRWLHTDYLTALIGLDTIRRLLMPQAAA